MSEKPMKRVWARWVVLAAIILGLFLFTGFFGIGLGIKPIMPHVYLPGEKLSETPLFGIAGLYPTNTLVGLLLADIVVILIAIGVSRGVKSGKTVLTGISGAVEALLEMLHGITEGTAGKWTKQIFPWFATITLLVLAANWSGLIPGNETVGLIHHYDHGYDLKQVGPITTIWDEGTDDGEHHGEYAIVPFLRPVSTDLNFTFALAIVAVVMIQVFGFRSQGLGYLTKFWNTKTLFSKPIFGVIDFGVGILELVSEISKVLSFAFRLFGNMFAGAVLLFVIGSLVPVFAQSMFYLLEFFVGLIQAIVFGMLTMVFMSQATQGHGEHHEEAH
ncbi:MAG TPA: F0F1 ATP synthase subunit A [Anaerolineales bacterium]|nr:F0F1 ATP synthase subunit A [Anaerolineales bacterium]